MKEAPGFQGPLSSVFAVDIVIVILIDGGS